MNFRQKLEYGKAGESCIARWLRRDGYIVLPVYEKAFDDHKGPRLYLPSNELIAPDLLIMKNGKAYWIEAKRKHAFTWHRNTECFVTGIDQRHYHDYCIIGSRTRWPVWLFFLQEGGQAKNSPPSPPGLYGQSLAYLRDHEHHRHWNWGPSGMVYWAIDDLKLWASLDELELQMTQEAP